MDNQKTILQLLPMNEQTKVTVSNAGHNPQLQLTTHLDKPVSILLKHCTRKWVQINTNICVFEKFRIYPRANHPQHNKYSIGWGQESKCITLQHIFELLGCPALFQLEYGEDNITNYTTQHTATLIPTLNPTPVQQHSLNTHNNINTTVIPSFMPSVFREAILTPVQTQPITYSTPYNTPQPSLVNTVMEWPENSLLQALKNTNNNDHAYQCINSNPFDVLHDDFPPSDHSTFSSQQPDNNTDNSLWQAIHNLPTTRSNTSFVSTAIPELNRVSAPLNYETPITSAVIPILPPIRHPPPILPLISQQVTDNNNHHNTNNNHSNWDNDATKFRRAVMHNLLSMGMKDMVSHSLHGVKLDPINPSNQEIYITTKMKRKADKIARDSLKSYYQTAKKSRTKVKTKHVNKKQRIDYIHSLNQNNDNSCDSFAEYLEQEMLNDTDSPAS